MAESESEESGRPGKRRAEAGSLGAGPSCWRRDGGEDFHLAAEDPLVAFGSEIMTIILGMLDIRSLAEARLVSRGWQAVASSDRIWEPKDFFLIFRSSPCVYLLWKSGIASHGGLTANANWSKDGNKESPVSSELINDPDLHLKNRGCSSLMLSTRKRKLTFKTIPCKL